MHIFQYHAVPLPGSGSCTRAGRSHLAGQAATITRHKSARGLMASALLAGLALATTLPAPAAMIAVDQFGLGGWMSDDTRTAAGVDLVGIASTHAGKPGQVPAAADDAAIATQIQFVNGPSGSTYGGAVSVNGTSGNSGKSTISVVSPILGFAPANDLLDPSFFATYQWYGQPDPTSRTLAFRLGIQSTDWAASQSAFTAVRSGESVWDLILVHVPGLSDNTWTTVNVDHLTGTWALYDQAGNPYFTTPGGATMQTLDDWAADPTWGPLLFGTGAVVSSVQFGLGSSQRQSIAYVDYLQTSLLNDGDVINFTPEPSRAILVLGGLGLSLMVRRRPRVK